MKTKVKVRIAVKKNGHCFYSQPYTISEACEAARAVLELIYDNEEVIRSKLDDLIVAIVDIGTGKLLSHGIAFYVVERAPESEEVNHNEEIQL